MIEFYGAPMSSAGRTHLVLEECGVPYAYHKVNLRDPAAKAAFREINPSGKIPFIVDGELRLVESIAINFYLAEKYAPRLWSDSIDDRANIYAWSLWSITNFQPPTLAIMLHSMLLPADKRRPEAVADGKRDTQQHLDELERGLAGGHLVANRLTVADLNVASVANIADRIGGFAIGPHTTAWLAAIRDRPAWQNIAAQG